MTKLIEYSVLKEKEAGSKRINKKNDPIENIIVMKPINNAPTTLLALFIFAFILTVVSLVRYIKVVLYHKLRKKQQLGHLCKRMYDQNYITSLDTQFLNRGWHISIHVTEKFENDYMLKLYKEYFYLVKDRDIDFEAITPKIKQLVADLRENGDRDILRD